MDLKRQPYMLRDDRQKSMAMDRKIKELEEKAQKQSKQVRQLMLGGNTLSYFQNNQHHSPVARIENEQLQNKTQTARKRPTGLDYLKCSGRINTLPSTQDPMKKGWEPPPVVNLPSRPQEKSEDKQMQYLKSEEYKKYLQKCMGVDAKEDKVKYMKQNRNHNIYLGNRGGQKRDYIQAMLKSKQFLPRVHHNYGYDRYPYPQRQMTTNSYRRSVSPLNSYRRQNVARYQYEQVKQLPKENHFFQSPIKEAKKLYEGDLTKKQVSQNGTLILSPVCIKKAFKNQQQPKKVEKPEKNKLENKKPTKKLVKQFNIAQKQNKKPIIQKAEKVQKRNNFTDHKISWERQTSKNNQTSAKMSIYKKQIQFSDKKVKSIEKGDKQYKKYKKLQTCLYKIIPQQQSFSEKSKSLEKYCENSSSYSSDTKSPSKNKKDIYNVSFKLDKPDKVSQKRLGEVNKKQSSYQYKSSLKAKNALSHRAEPYNYYEKQHNIDYRRYQQRRKRIETQVYYEKNIPYNYYHAKQDIGLQYSQTQSATTIQTDKHQNSKSPRKISIISKSKMK